MIGGGARSGAGRVRAACAALVLAAVAGHAAEAIAQGAASLSPPTASGSNPAGGWAVPMRAAVSPVVPVPHLGDRLTYRGWIAADPSLGVRWVAPDREGDLVWGPVRTGRAPLKRRQGAGTPWPADSVWVEAPLQIFTLGDVRVPGLAFRLESGGGVVRNGRLPMTMVRVRPLLAASDSNASLRPPRGPLAAPWWERIGWGLLIAILVVAAAVVWLVRRLRRRKPAVAPAGKPVVARRRDPAAEALAELASLRRRELPEKGRFAEHAFLLGRILRRYLEASFQVPRPGDTTPELVRHLRECGLADSDLERLTQLLRRWDGIKFARLESDVQEAERCEEAVRDLVVRRSRPVRQEVA